MKVQIKKCTFYSAWIIYIINYVLFEQSQFKNILGSGTFTRGIKAFVVILLLICIFLRRSVSIRFIKLGSLVGAIFLMAYFTADSWTVLFWGLFSLAAVDNIEYREFLRIDIPARTLLYLFVLVCAFTGVLKNDSIVVYGNEKVTLGYIHYNMFGMNMGVLVTEIIAWFRDDKKNTRRMYLLVIAICAVQVLVGVGRTGLYASTVIIVLSIILENRKIKAFVEDHCSFFSVSSVIFAIGSYGISFAYDSGNKIMQVLNLISSTRIAFSNLYLSRYDLSIFGQQLYINNDAVKGQYSALDMGYIRVGLEYGLLILFLMVLMFYIIQKESLKTNNVVLYLASLYFCMTLLVATSVMNVANDWILIFTIQILVRRDTFFEQKISGGSNFESRLMHTI